MDYINLDLELSNYQKNSSNQETFCVHVVRSSCGYMTSDKAVPVTLSAEQRKQISLLKEPGLSKGERIERGELLGEMRFPPQIRSIYNGCLIGLKDGQRLRVRLTLGNYALSDLPWEFAYILPPSTPDDQKDLSGFLVLNKEVSLVRFPALEGKGVSLNPVGEGKLRMVVIMANPKKDLKIGEEFKKIQDALKEVPAIVPEPHSDATIQTLQDALMNPAHIFHFAGHGGFEGDLGTNFKSTSGQGYIILLDKEGMEKKLSAGDLASLLCASQVRLAVLMACETGATDQINAWTGVVPALIRKGIPSVVGMQFRIEDENALAFSRQFYFALAKGLPIDAAVAEGRQAILLRGDENERDWGVPVLYLRAEEGVLFPPDYVAPIKAGLNLLREMIGKEKDVADAVCLSKKEIETTYRQIEKLKLLKTIHDELHNIERDCLLTMQKGKPVFPPLPYTIPFSNAAARIWEAIEKLKISDSVYRLQLDRLKTVEDAFAKSVETPGVATYKEVVSALNTLLTLAPSEIDKRISDAAAELNLDDMVKLMKKVSDKMPAAAAGHDAEIELFRKSIEALNTQQEDLKRRVSEHGCLQDLDKELRSTCSQKAFPGDEEWMRIKTLRARLGDPFSAQLKAGNKVLDLFERKIEEAVKGSQKQAARKDLEGYFFAVSCTFREVDSSLRDFCMRLSEVSQPLEALLKWV
jgi:CHAT domain-containing protein